MVKVQIQQSAGALSTAPLPHTVSVSFSLSLTPHTSIHLNETCLAFAHDALSLMCLSELYFTSLLSFCSS